MSAKGEPFIMIAGVLVIVCASLTTPLAFDSQPPTPGSGESEGQPPHSEPATQQSESGQDMRGTERDPIVIRVAPKSEIEAAQDERQRQDESSARWGTVWLTGLTLIVLLVQCYVMWRQNQIMENQSGTMSGQLAAAKVAAHAAEASADALRNSERAYISIRHWSAADKGDGRTLGFHPCEDQNPDRQTTKYRLEIRVTNVGKSPATVIGGQIQRVLNLQHFAGTFAPVDYLSVNSAERIMGTFLHPNEKIFRKLTYELHNSELTELAAQHYWLVGYVIYKDHSTKIRYRTDYCRHINNVSKGKNNLEIDDTSLPYNDDYEIDENGNRKG
jgi:hypothetical protein